MHSTKKGSNWYYGMKMHTGVDAGSGYIHTIVGTPANVHDITEIKNLLREDDTICYEDSGYLSVERRKEIKEDKNFSNVKFITNKRPGYIKKLHLCTVKNKDKKNVVIVIIIAQEYMVLSIFLLIKTPINKN